MRRLLRHLDPKRIWMMLFLGFFCLIPLCIADASILWSAALFGVCTVIVYKFDLPKFSLMLFLIAFAVRVAIVLVLDTPPESDFAILFDASQRLLAGDTSFMAEPYFSHWAYQVGFVFVQTLFLRIWNDILILKLVNCFVTAATVLLVYRIARRFAGEKASQIASLVYCFFPYSLFYVTVLTNQFLSTFLILLGVCLLLSKNETLRSPVKYAIFAGLLASANVIRPESIIPLFATALYLLLTTRRDNVKTQLLDLAALVVTYFALTKFFSALFVWSGLSPTGLANNAPYWKFVLGFNHDSLGRYTDADHIYLRDPQAAWSIVRDRILVPVPQLLMLFIRKIRLFWSAGDMRWAFSYCLESGLSIFGRTLYIANDYMLLDGISRVTVIVLYLLTAVGVFRIVRRKTWDPKLLLILNQIFVTFGVYLLIEIQTRYAYHVFACIPILAALGIDAVRERLKKPSDPEGDSHG